MRLSKHWAVIVMLLTNHWIYGQSPVIIEEKPLVIPTYQVAPPDKNPIFYSGRIYQGAQGFIYPHPLYDVLTDERKDQTYDGIYIDNEYLEICIVPELGGRIFSALDKTDQYDFFYRQHVIKPSLIGMIGAWLSGGVEWNIPDHHRATSHLPVDYTLADNADGSKTAWVGETELTRGLKWTVGLTVYPGKSYVEATIRVFNPTPFMHSFLYWANVSVHCDENYQVIFPPSTQYGAQHAKGEFTSWPVGSGKYGGLDRTGVDLSWWKNHPNPTSVFAWNFTDDFLAGYDFGKNAGTVHVANHHVVTGKKFFLWGNNDEAEMWEKMLTETDGQYLELMVGAYSDNQPDYSWIAPGETKVFKQYWYPIQKIGGVKNASKEAAVNLERKSPGSLQIGLSTTSPYKKARVVVNAANKVLFETLTDIDPATPWLKEVPVETEIKDTDIKVSLFDANGQELISYQPVIAEKEEQPAPVEVPGSPEGYKSVEELYLTGLRIEQFKNAVIDPMPYYQEALKRDSLDSRTNTILGIRYCKEGKYKEAEEHLRRAIQRTTKNYTRPKDGEALYYLGVVLQMQNRLTEANDAFWKAAWNAGFQSSAFYNLAQLTCRDSKFNDALQLIDQSIAANNLNTVSLSLKAYILRKTGDYDKAVETLKLVENIDKLDTWAASELYFLDAVSKGQKNWDETNRILFKKHLGGNVQYALELAKNYGNSGAYEEAIVVLDQFKSLSENQQDFPMLAYYTGYYHLMNGKPTLALQHFQEASKDPSDYCFPWRLEEMEILKTALKHNPGDSKGWYYLGNLHYHLNQKENAISNWEQSVSIDEKFSYAWRNLGFAYEKVSHDLNKSIAAYEKAILLNDQDPRLFAEIDAIKEHAGIAPADRLSFLLKHVAAIEKHDEAMKRVVELYLINGEYNKSLKILTDRHFHVWEGGASLLDYFENANLMQGIHFLEKKRYQDALISFERAATYPDNLEEGKSVFSVREVRINYYIALTYSGLGNKEQADFYYNKVAEYAGSWNHSDLEFYKAMALKKLNRKDEAGAVLENLRKYADEQLNSAGETDFFTKFNVDTRQETRKARNYYLLGLTYLGEGDTQLANENFSKSIELDQNQVWPGIMCRIKISL